MSQAKDISARQQRILLHSPGRHDHLDLNLLLNVTAQLQAMSSPLSNGLDRSASKRARSTDSSHSGASTPAPKALKTEQDDEAPDDTSVPAFLRQSAAGKLPRVHA